VPSSAIEANFTGAKDDFPAGAIEVVVATEDSTGAIEAVIVRPFAIEANFTVARDDFPDAIEAVIPFAIEADFAECEDDFPGAIEAVVATEDSTGAIEAVILQALFCVQWVGAPEYSLSLT
jgi:hypothetical protein